MINAAKNKSVANQAAIKFFVNIDCMSEFLMSAVNAIRATGRELSATEKHGFHLCIMALKENVADALRVGGRI